MKVALLGYGRQGKKHKEVWEGYGITPDIFTRFGSNESFPIVNFHPNNYTIIICAIAPLEEQTKMIYFILSQGYENYLILEKPVTYSRELLTMLSGRNRTIFFIDEIFLPQCILQGEPKHIATTSENQYSDFAISEHAIANFLHFPRENIDFRKITFSHSIGSKVTYTISFEGENADFFMDMKNMIFSSVYKELMRKMQDEFFLANVRNNYLRFRSYGQFHQYFT